MSSFLEQYGTAIFTLVLVAILIAFAGPLGMKIKNATTEKVCQTEQIGNDEIRKTMSVYDKDTNETLIAGATFTDGTTLTWEELKDSKNGSKYGYRSSQITDTEILLKNYRGAFEGCTTITSVVIPAGIIVGDYAFFGCKNLTTVVLSEGVTTMRSRCFIESGVTSIRIPSTIQSIGDYIVEGNHNSATNNVWDLHGFQHLYYNGTKEQWKAIKKGSNWAYRAWDGDENSPNYGKNNYKVHCSDGDI